MVQKKWMWSCRSPNSSMGQRAILQINVSFIHPVCSKQQTNALVLRYGWNIWRNVDITLKLTHFRIFKSFLLAQDIQMHTTEIHLPFLDKSKWTAYKLTFPRFFFVVEERHQVKTQPIIFKVFLAEMQPRSSEGSQLIHYTSLFFTVLFFSSETCVLHFSKI